ncbi:MAG: enoyl-CoA hydratase [Thalassospira sp.]|uniref:enoyl-CoA hydratase n=1 Tax=Thalassospira sp. TaxID=1912094 RepID=UPI0032ED88CB
MSEGKVTLSVQGNRAVITFDRPDSHNAMTKTMYSQLYSICVELGRRDDIRVAVLRGKGGAAFVAGSDISIFDTFSSGQDGIDYEAEMEVYTRALEDLPFPTIAVIEGWAVGGGLNLASVCDIRISTPNARMGVPIAKTVGNCLSIFNYARLVAGFGASRAKRLMIMGDFIGADEARACGFLTEVVTNDELEDRVDQICNRIERNAPITMRVSKQAIGRVLKAGIHQEAEDLIAAAYGSKDFKVGISGFQTKTQPQWRNE